MLGIRRVLDETSDGPIVVPDLISAIEKCWGGISQFPYTEISEDILSFTTRNRRSRS